MDYGWIAGLATIAALAYLGCTLYRLERDAHQASLDHAAALAALDRVTAERDALRARVAQGGDR